MIAPLLTSRGPRVQRDHVDDHCVYTYALPATRVSMIAQVCIRAPLPLLRVIRHYFCEAPGGTRNLGHPRNIDECAKTGE